MKKILLGGIFLFLFLAHAVAQEKQVQGIVFDRDSKQRITRVYIYNTRTHKGFFNNIKGEFTTNAAKGDTLVAALQGYLVDFAMVPSGNTVVFYLKRNSIQLKQVTITDTLKSAQKRFEQNQKDYQDIYRKGNDKDLISVGGNGAGLSIDALYSLFSREGKNARYLQKIIERDYHESMINYRYTKSLVTNATELKGNDLDDFMQQYRPSYNFILEANDYQLIQFIKSSYLRYKANPAAFRLKPLKP